MKKLLTFYFVLLTAVCFGQITSKVVRSGTRMGYLLHLPSGYNPSASTKYPVLIFLHGSGERGIGSSSDLDKVKKQGVGKQLNNGATFSFSGTKMIVVCPQTNHWSYTVRNKDGMTELEEFIKYIKATYQDDSTRYYITGLSMGGRGSWDAVSVLPNNYFAAAMPVSANAAAGSVKTVTVSRHMPIWAFHAIADSAIKWQAGYVPIKAMLSVNASPSPIWTKVPGYCHCAPFWDKVYDINQATYAPYTWMLTKSKAGGF